jgi:aryl-alcohol dehydrogenase-like predicted oxidoreductase
MNHHITRRQLLELTIATAALSGVAHANGSGAITRSIPTTGENIPVIGLGTSRTLDIALNPETEARLRELMAAFIDTGGTLVDTSPMYGPAESVLGQITHDLPGREKLFTATKVWTTGREEGIAQMNLSMQKMGVDRIDLMQIHNLVDWKTQLSTLRDWKERGIIRYIGITTSHQQNHKEFERIMTTEPIDFVQFSYNIDNRTAEQRLLPLAADRGIATLINRPYARGSLFRRAGDTPLTELGKELGCVGWSQFFLKFILGHPAVSCLIPATNKVHHLKDNMGAGYGALPDAAQRREMVATFESL